MNSGTIVDLAFPITPGHVPIDHGYLLYSALSNALPDVHHAPWLGIHPLSGRKLTAAALVLTPGSAVTLRLPAANIGQVLGLVGRALRLADHVFELGAPIVRALLPMPNLFAWQVALRLTRPPTLADGDLDMAAFRTAFETEASRQLSVLGISKPFEVLSKRVVRIKEQQIIAFSVEIRDLTAEQSVRLQANGLGGKRRMGCGVFRCSRVEIQGE